MHFRFYPVILVFLSIVFWSARVEPVWSQEPVDNTEAPTESRPTDTPEEIAVGADKVEDSLITQRLAEVFQNLPELANVDIAVKAGVVRLTGHTSTKEAHQQALELAERVDGVVSVTDEITQKREVRERLTVVQEKMVDQLNNFISYLPLLIIGFTVFLLFWFLASFLTKWDNLYERITPHAFLQSLAKQIVKGTVIFIGFVAMLEILDATALLGTIVGVAGVMGLAVGFALRDTVENYIASILLSIRQPFRPLDQIVLENYEGLVMKLTSRETILMTLDGNHVRIPNATVYKGIILNYSRNPKRRFSFEVGIDTAVKIEAALQLAIKTLEQTVGVIADPPVRCTVEKLGDSNVILKMFAWTTQDQYDFGKVKSEAIRAVKEAFDLANYEMPEPIYRLKMQGASPPDDQPVFDHSEQKRDAPAPAVQSGSQADVTKDNHIVEQISKDRADIKERDLLKS
ncbi:mechanosensitive ion channel family protein [Candidatus Nitrospira neomarina]|uniref:Mechanosensitive ion channel family protein n=1 Tax=Candidatus Nitrospira neomarina TaxID=3020899 RepID=A0AA96JWS9_9BACT|nr:mechanosensitive ion channel family protein [Candidatus Nitrospira neomarina]WNM62370.1 mechanosensitive ion channel family protein [Candidatus Nitrospira neomarina]